MSAKRRSKPSAATWARTAAAGRCRTPDPGNAGTPACGAWQWRRRELASDGASGANDPASDRSQEWELYFEEFIELFEDDHVAHAVLLAVMAGNKGKELLAVIGRIFNNDAGVEGRGGRRATDVEIERELERVLKKIRRRSEKHRREGGL